MHRTLPLYTLQYSSTTLYSTSRYKGYHHFISLITLSLSLTSSDSYQINAILFYESRIITREIRQHGCLITNGYKTAVLEFILMVDFINSKQVLVYPPKLGVVANSDVEAKNLTIKLYIRFSGLEFN